MNPQNYAIRIEHIMCDTFGCDRFGMGGFVNSDYIRRHPFMAIMSTLTYLYGRNEANCISAVSNFFDTYHYYGEWSIDELLSFEGNSKVINGSLYEIDYKNGEEALQSIIDAFSEVCTQLN